MEDFTSFSVTFKGSANYTRGYRELQTWTKKHLKTPYVWDTNFAGIMNDDYTVIVQITNRDPNGQLLFKLTWGGSIA